MKIEIDTKRDTKEDIIKIIRMLQSIVSESSSYSQTGSSYNTYTPPENTSSADLSAGFGFLDSPSTTSTPSANNSSSDIVEEKKEPRPRVELY